MGDRKEDAITSSLLEGLSRKTKYYRDLSHPLKYSDYDIMMDPKQKTLWEGPSPLTVIHIDGYKPVRTDAAFSDDRVVRNESMINQTIQYAKKNGLPVPKTKLHVWVSDRQPWGRLNEVDKSVPVYLYAAPRNSRFILFPDNTYDLLEISRKYSGTGLNWDQIKSKFYEQSDKINKQTSGVIKQISGILEQIDDFLAQTGSFHEHKDELIKKISAVSDRMNNILKQNVIYFKGTPTTLRHSRIREQIYLNTLNDSLCTGKETLFKPGLQRESNDVDIVLKDDIKRNVTPSDKMIIQLDAWKSYIPVWEFAKYKYLLNLPGHYPWSNRMKYLFLTKSLVINVSVTTKGSDYVDEPFDTISDYIFKPDEDYVDIGMTYFVPKRRHGIDTPVEQITENNRVYKEILSVMNTPSEAYARMTKSAYDKANAFSMEHIYMYLYHLILFNAEIF